MRPLQSLLVTGGCGFIGSAFIRKLLSLSDFHGNIVNLDLLTYAASEENVSAVSSDPRYRFVQGDILDGKLVSEILASGIDTIVHFAAETHVDRSIFSALPFIETNVKGTLSLLEAVRLFPSVHFHHISTDEVYGSLGKEGVFHEESAYRPNSPYSASKAASDHLVRAFAHTYGLSTTMSHCSNNYGPGQYPEKLIPLMIQKCLLGENLPVYGKGTNVREWLYVDDHAEAVLRILQEGRKGEVYDIGSNEELSNLEVIHLLLAALSQETGEKIEKYLSLVSFVADRPGHDFRYAIDSSKIQKELKWFSKISLKEGLQKTVRFYVKKFLQTGIQKLSLV